VSLHYMDMNISNSYYDNTKVFQNCVVENPQFLIDDFTKIGFKDISCDTGVDYFTGCKTYYVKGYK
jgi:hypothetical protein